MAVEDNVRTLGSTWVAAADLSAARYKLVKQTAAGQVNLCTASTDEPVGVLLNAPTSGQPAEVATEGVVKVIAGAAITQGVQLMPDASSRVITAATTGNKTYGRAIEAASGAGQVISVLIPGIQRILP